MQVSVFTTIAGITGITGTAPPSIMMTLISYSDWKLWDTRDGKLVESFDGHRSDVTGIAINSKGTGGWVCIKDECLAALARVMM